MGLLDLDPERLVPVESPNYRFKDWLTLALFGYRTQDKTLMETDAVNRQGENHGSRQPLGSSSL
jgi:hypothetical protein